MQHLGSPVMAGKINLKGSWDSLWNALQGQAGPILDLCAVVGVVIVVAALGKWFWERRRGQGGGNSSGIWWALAIGCMLSAPSIIIPICLFMFDVVANAAVDVFNSAK